MGSVQKFFRRLLLPIFALAFFASPVFAQEKVTSQNAIVVATVNVQDIELTSQQENVFQISFSITNREGIQPKIVYGVNLLKKDTNGEYFIVDQKIYDKDIVSLGSNERVQKQIAYTAPAYLNGSYALQVVAKNPDGLLLGMVQTLSEVTLNGTGEGIEIDPVACFLTVDGEEGNKAYTLSQGVDIAEQETLTAHCTLKNVSQASQNILPVLETRYRSTFGKVVDTKKLDAVALGGGQIFDFSAQLPKVSTPQAYDSVLTFLNEKQEKVSPMIDFHYVLRGESATIQNLTLDKDIYQKGDTAKLNFFWSGTVNNFGEAREKAENEGSLSAVFTITDGQKKSCAEPFMQTLDIKRQANMEYLSIPMTRDCVNPIVQVKMNGKDGKVLASNTYDIQSKSDPEKARAMSQSKDRSSLGSVMAYGFALLFIIALAWYLLKKHKKTGMMAILGLLMAGGTLLGGRDAQADTFYIADFPLQIDPTTTVSATSTFTVNINKSNYSQGETIIATGQYVSTICDNGVDRTVDTAVTLEATINGATKSVENRSDTFTAQNTAGNYSALFEAAVWHSADGGASGNYSVVASNSLSIPYTVGGSAASNTLTGSNCTIAAGASNCNSSFTWNISSPSSPNLYNSTRAVTYATTASGSGSYAIAYGNNTVQARNGTTVLSVVSVTATCASGSSWDGTKCVASLGSTATLTGSNCTIASGASNCSALFTWNISSPSSPNLYNATRAVTYSVNPSGSNISYPLVYGANTVQARNGATVLSSVTATASCASGSSWDGARCAASAPITLTFSANPTSVASGGSSMLSWTSNAASCSASGAWSGSKAASGNEQQNNITTSRTYTLTCPPTGASAVTKSVTVGVCSDTIWSPDPSGTCSKDTLTQTSNCGNTRVVSGTKTCTNLNWREVAP